MDLGALEKYYEEQAGLFPGKVHYLYADLTYRKRILDHGAQDQVVASGMIKIPILMAVYHKLEKEMIDPEEELLVPDEFILPDTQVFEYGGRTASVQELVTWMAIKGDNTATNVLIEYLGYDYINKALMEYGLEHTHVGSKMLDPEAHGKGHDNVTCALDIFQCMSYLKNNELTHLYAGLGIDLLRSYRDSSCICRYLYERFSIAHMTGMRHDVITDCGIIETGSDTFFLGVFVSGFESNEDNEKEARKLIGRMARKTVDLYMAY